MIINEIYNLLKEKMKKEEYENPHFVSDLLDLLENYECKISDEIYDWVKDNYQK